MSTLETVNRGFEAVATTVMRYRCSVEDTAALWGGCPGGTKTTSSRSNTRWTSLAATRCPWWIGSNVPPITPIRRCARSPSAGVIGPASCSRGRSVPLVRGVAEGPHQAQQRHEPDHHAHADGQRGHGKLAALGQHLRDAHRALRPRRFRRGVGSLVGPPSAYSLAEADQTPPTRHPPEG